SYGSLAVGRVENAFCSDATWHGTFVPAVQSTDGPLARRLLGYISFCAQWNERTRKNDSADPAEFDPYNDLIKSGAWTAEWQDGKNSCLPAAPVFFSGGEISWRVD